MDSLYLALAVFLITYFLISFRRIPVIKLSRSSAALFGAFLMVALGILSMQRAWEALDIEVIMLLSGMMLLVGTLQSCGMFEIICVTMVRLSSTPLRFFLLIMTVSAILSALVLNDAVVLLFTPVIIEACIRLRVNPVPYLIGEVMAANIGSVATVVGNPQNAFIATRAGIGFLDFSVNLVPVAVLCLLASMMLLVFIFRRDLWRVSFPSALDPDGLMTLHQVRQVENQNSCRRLIPRKRLLPLLAVLTLGTVMAFAFSHQMGVPLSHIAFISGAAAVILSVSLTDLKPRELVDRVDWSIILFFLGLFVVIQGVTDSGLLSAFQVSPIFGGGESVLDLPGLTMLSAVLSNLFSNVPSVMLLAEMIPVGETELWLILAASSTLAGNATLLGSAANIIMAERAERLGQEIDFWRFMLIGLPVTAMNLVICILIFTVF